MKPHLTREQIEKHPLIHADYKKQMLAELDEQEQAVKKRARIGMYVLALLFLITALIFGTGCSDKDRAFRESQARLQWKLDSLQRARTSDGFQDNQEISHERDYNSSENQKIIIRESK